MFDLELSVRNWRESVRKEIGDRAELMDELEQHLRDDFERRAASGESPANAWAAALEHLGAGHGIAGEFAKLEAHFWLPAWLAVAGLVLVMGAMSFVAIAMRRPLLGAHVLLITTGYCAVFFIGFLSLIAVFSRAIGRWAQWQQDCYMNAGRRLALVAFLATVAGVGLGGWWAHTHLGRWWAWDPKEIGGACVLAWSGVLLECFRSRSSTPQSLMLLGVMGNFIVALSWFGPFLAVQNHLYARAPALFGAILGVFLIIQILFVYVAALQSGALRLNRFRGTTRG